MTQGSQLGDFLVESGLVARKQLEVAVVHQKMHGGALTSVLAEKGFVDEDKLARSLSAKLGLGFVNLLETDIPERVLALVPKSFAEQKCVLPVAIKRHQQTEYLFVAFADPFDFSTLRTLERNTGRHIHILVSPITKLMRSIELRYRGIPVGSDRPGVGDKPATPSVDEDLPEIELTPLDDVELETSAPIDLGQPIDEAGEPATGKAPVSREVPTLMPAGAGTASGVEEIQIDIGDPEDDLDNVATGQVDIMALVDGGPPDRSPLWAKNRFAGTLEIPVEGGVNPSPFDGPQLEDIPTGLDRTGFISIGEVEGEIFEPPPLQEPPSVEEEVVRLATDDIPKSEAAVRARQSLATNSDGMDLGSTELVERRPVFSTTSAGAVEAASSGAPTSNSARAHPLVADLHDDLDVATERPGSAPPILGAPAPVSSVAQRAAQLAELANPDEDEATGVSEIAFDADYSEERLAVESPPELLVLQDPVDDSTQASLIDVQMSTVEVELPDRDAKHAAAVAARRADTDSASVRPVDAVQVLLSGALDRETERKILRALVQVLLSKGVLSREDINSEIQL